MKSRGNKIENGNNVRDLNFETFEGMHNMHLNDVEVVTCTLLHIIIVQTSRY